MARRSGVELDPKLRRLLQRLEPELQGPIKEVIAESGEMVAHEAARRVPIRTGALARSIGVRVGSGGWSSTVGFSEKYFKREWKKAGWRAKFIEYGTKGYTAGEKRASGHGKTTKAVPARPARPFLRPAFLALRDQLLERQRRIVNATLERVAGG